MPPVINDMVVIENGFRLYTLFCAVCGKDGMTEPESMHQMQCHSCGNNTLRVIRNKKLEGNREMFTAGGSFND